MRTHGGVVDLVPCCLHARGIPHLEICPQWLVVPRLPTPGFLDVDQLVPIAGEQLLEFLSLFFCFPLSHIQVDFRDVIRDYKNSTRKEH